MSAAEAGDRPYEASADQRRHYMATDHGRRMLATELQRYRSVVDVAIAAPVTLSGWHRAPRS
jgi:hypothetical protein